MRKYHDFEEMTPDKRPAHGWSTMPQAIRFTDANGRSAIYLPVKEDGKVVDSKGFGLEE